MRGIRGERGCAGVDIKQQLKILVIGASKPPVLV